MEFNEIMNKRTELVQQLKELEEKQQFIQSRIRQTKENIRKNTQEYVQQFVNIFKPDTFWVIENKNYHTEYFNVINSETDRHYSDYEDIDECMISVACRYLRIENPEASQQYAGEKYRFKDFDYMHFKIKEIPKIKQVTAAEWNKALEKMLNSEKA